MRDERCTERVLQRERERYIYIHIHTDKVRKAIILKLITDPGAMVITNRGMI